MIPFFSINSNAVMNFDRKFSPEIFKNFPRIFDFFVGIQKSRRLVWVGFPLDWGYGGWRFTG